MTNFYQCRLKHYNGSTDMVWIEADYAYPENPIERKINGSWEDGWTVSEVFEPGICYETIRENQNNYKKHRQGSDIL